MRLYPCDDPEHRTAAELLPWFVNGTLERHEQARVARHLLDCIACNKELEALREVRALLLRDRALGTPGLPDASDGARRDVPARDLDARRSLVRWRGLAAAQLALIAILGVALLMRGQPALYHTLAAPTVAIAGEDTVIVVFDGRVPEKDVRDAILGVRARIVDGPGPSGDYTLHVSSSERDRAIARLRSQRGVLLAEPGTGR